MKKQERALFVVSLIVLLLVWVMNGNRASAADYNFYFYDAGEGEKKQKVQQPSQETRSFETSEAGPSTEEKPTPEEEVKTKTATVVTQPPVRLLRRFLSAVSSVFRSIPDDAYLSVGWEFNHFTDKKRDDQFSDDDNFKDETNSLSVRAKILPPFGLEASIPFKAYNPGLRIFKGGLFSEWELPQIGRTNIYLKPWHNIWNFFQTATLPAVHISTGLLYNSRHAYDEHLWRSKTTRYGHKYDYKLPRTEAAASLSEHSWYVGGGTRFRLFSVIDLTASLNIVPVKKANYLFSAGASVVF